MESVKKYLKITGRFRKAAKISQGVMKLISFARLAKFLLACENFARGCEIHQFRKACEIPFWLAKISQGVVKFILSFARLAKFLLGQFTSLQIFRKCLRISWMLDSFSDSLPCILDWFGKGFEALPNLDSSCNLASILLCHGLHQVFPHSWLVLMIEKLSKTSKLAKN